MAIENGQLIIASLEQSDLVMFLHVIQNKHGDHSWPNTLHVYCGFGREDFVLIAYDQKARDVAKEIFKKLGLVIGRHGSHSDGWSRVYSCDLNRKMGSLPEKCYTFGTLCLFETPDRMPNFNDMMKKQKVEQFSVWETDGYYNFCLLHEKISHSWVEFKISPIIQTYSIPLASMRWVLDKIDSTEEDFASAIGVLAKIEPSLHVSGTHALCAALKKSAVNGDLIDCSMNHLVCSHGNCDVIFTSYDNRKGVSNTEPVKINLGQFTKNIVRLKRDCDFILSTRTRIHSKISSEVSDEAKRKLSQSECTQDVLGSFPCEPDCTIEKGSRNSLYDYQGPVQPLVPYNVRDMAEGRDWSLRMKIIRNEIEPIITNAYNDSMREIFGSSKFPPLKFHYRLAWGDLPSRVIPPKNDQNIIDSIYTLVFSNEIIGSKTWSYKVITEMIEAALHAVVITGKRLLLQRNIGAGFFLHKDNYNRNIDDIITIFLKIVNSPASTCLCLLIGKKGHLDHFPKIKNMKEYLNNVWDMKFPKNEELFLGAATAVRLILSLFFKNRLMADPEGDSAGLNWISELEKAHKDFDKSKIKTNVNVSPSNFFAGMYGLEAVDFTAAAKANYTEFLDYSWVCVLNLLRRLSVHFEIPYIEVESKTKTTSDIKPITFFRGLMSDDPDLLKAFNLSAKVLNRGKNIDRDIECIETYVKELSDCEKFIPSIFIKKRVNVEAMTKYIHNAYDRFNPKNHWVLNRLAWQDHKLHNLIRLRDLKTETNDLYGTFLPKPLFEKFQKPEDSKFKPHGGEYLSKFVKTQRVKLLLDHDEIFPGKFEIFLKGLRLENDGDKKYYLRYPTAMGQFVGRPMGIEPRAYTTLQVVKKMIFEIACAERLAKFMESKKVLDFKGAPVSFNLTSWLLEPEYNPWQAEFCEEYLGILERICDGIKKRNGLCVVELPEGPLPKEYDQGVWYVIRELIDKNKLDGCAVDDQWGEGTDIKRLEVIAEFFAQQLVEDRLNLFMCKTDHLALFSLLKLKENWDENKKNLTYWPDAFRLLYQISMMIIEDTHLSDEVRNKIEGKLIIVFEGFKGHYSFSDEQRKKYQTEVFAIMKKLKGDFPAKILMQG